MLCYRLFQQRRFIRLQLERRTLTIDKTSGAQTTVMTVNEDFDGAPMNVSLFFDNEKINYIVIMPIGIGTITYRNRLGK